MCSECSETPLCTEEYDTKAKPQGHCSDCQDWRKYVFINDDSLNECHCAYLTKDTLESAFEGEQKDMFKLENSVKKKCRAMQDSAADEIYKEFWKKDIPMIIDEFENAENGRLIPKTNIGKRQRKNVNIVNFDDNHTSEIQVYQFHIRIPDNCSEKTLQSAMLVI